MSIATTPEAIAVGQAFAAAYAGADDDRLRELLHPRLHQRELVPGAIVEYHRAEDTIAEAREFRAQYDRIEVLVNEVAPVGDLLRWSNRWRLYRAGTSSVIEFHGFLAIDDGRVTSIDAVCSGGRPEKR